MRENLAYLLWAFFRIESKILCKHNFHYYAIMRDGNRKCLTCNGGKT